MSDNKRYFYVVVMADDKTYCFRKVVMTGGAMFNAELLINDIINELNNDGSDRDRVEGAYIFSWTEFKNKEDYEGFIK